MSPSPLPPSLRAFIMSRPQLVEQLESMCGYRCWNRLDEPIDEVCRELSLNPETLARALADTPPISAKRDWANLPAYFLVDNLVDNHREFRETDLPRLSAIVDSVCAQFAPDHGPAKSLRIDFDSFRQEFLWHMQEEEEFLFPKILRTEACLRYPKLYPEIFKGSVNMYTSSHMHLPEEAFKEMVGSLKQKIHQLYDGQDETQAGNDIISKLDSFDAHLTVHTYLESEILFPGAAKLEQKLARRASAEENH